MKKIALLIFFSFFIVSISFTQQSNPTLLTIDDEQISKKEFLRIYNKNNQNIQSGDKASVDEYLDLFINFKLKVIEARNQKYDTIPSVKKEIQKHKKELAKPYLVDKNVLDTLIREAYERSKKEVKASHILIKFPKNMAYEDTAFAYKKTKDIRKRIINKKAPFAEVARGTSDDPSVKKNGGNLGYFTALQMVYPFETKTYNMATGQLSKPVRTKYGYHIIKKTGERKAKGKVRVAHIMLISPKSMSKEKQKEKKEKINEIYHKLMAGADFSEMAKKYSDDKGSARNGGKLPWFGVGRMVPSFEEAAFSLEKVGQFTTPVKTSIGWHIIKLLDKREIGSFEEEKNKLKRKITNNPRYSISRDSLIAKLKRTYNYTENDSAYSKFARNIVHEQKVDLSFARENNKNKTLIQFNNHTYTIQDFSDYLTKEVSKNLQKKYKGDYFVDKAFQEFSDRKIVEYEKEKLPEKYPEYKYTIKEYTEGILLFEIMDKKVWSKASEDTAGLKQYFNNHRDDYKWNERFRGKIYFADNKKVLEKTKKLKKGGIFKKSWSDQELLKKFNSENEKKLEIKKGMYVQGENKIIDRYAWDIGDKKEIKSNRPYFVRGKIIPPKNKKFNEVRGAVLADYQNYLEKQWIRELKNKYTINVNEEVLNSIKE
jgi:peptidyl-prolyl cis-trans isomerase SurA